MKNAKRYMIAAAAITMMLGIAGCSAGADEKEMTGAWEIVDDGTIAPELQELFDKAMEGFTGVGYVPVKLIEKQIVAGTNYRFLCDATVVYPGAETKQAVVTIYVDLDGNTEILSIEDIEETSSQIANPFVTVDTMEEAEKGAGYTFIAPEEPDGYNGTTISYIADNMIQVIFGEDDNSIYIRKAKGNDDISGDYNVYERDETITVSGQTVTVKGNGEEIRTVIWTDGDYSYSIFASTPITQELAESLVSAMK